MAPAYFGFQRRRVADVLFDEVSALSKSRNGRANSITDKFGRRMKLAILWLFLVFTTSVVHAGEGVPARWSLAFGNQSQVVWDRLNRDGIVTVSEIIEESYKRGSHYDGDRQLATAIVLITFDTDPLSALTLMMAERTPERRAFAAITAGLIGDVRFEAVLQRLLGDKETLGDFGGDWFWDTVADAAKQALKDLKNASLLKSLEVEKIRPGIWLKLPPK